MTLDLRAKELAERFEQKYPEHTKNKLVKEALFVLKNLSALDEHEQKEAFYNEIMFLIKHLIE